MVRARSESTTQRAVGTVRRQNHIGSPAQGAETSWRQANGQRMQLGASPRVGSAMKKGGGTVDAVAKESLASLCRLARKQKSDDVKVVIAH